jgi:hypothetical protein
VKLTIIFGHYVNIQVFSPEGRRVSVGLIVPKALSIINEKQHANIFAASKDCSGGGRLSYLTLDNFLKINLCMHVQVPLRILYEG